MPRPSLLDEAKQRDVLEALAKGCSRAGAARYAGCSLPAIAATARRDPEFARRLARAESQAELDYVKAIRDACQDQRHWRAAAWALERKYPDEYGRRTAGGLTAREVEHLLDEIADIIHQTVRSDRDRKAVLKRLWKLSGQSPTGPATTGEKP